MGADDNIPVIDVKNIAEVKHPVVRGYDDVTKEEAVKEHQERYHQTPCVMYRIVGKKTVQWIVPIEKVEEE